MTLLERHFSSQPVKTLLFPFLLAVTLLAVSIFVSGIPLAAVLVLFWTVMASLLISGLFHAYRRNWIGALVGPLMIALCTALLPTVGVLSYMRQASLNAGTWHDDPQNWSRAFPEDQIQGATVTRSLYWTSAHFTHEYIFFFHIMGTPEWLRSFLQQNDCRQVQPVRGFQRSTTDLTPDWFPAPSAIHQEWTSVTRGLHVYTDKMMVDIYLVGVQL